MGEGKGVSVGRTGVSVGGAGVSIGGLGVSVGGTGVSVEGIGVGRGVDVLVWDGVGVSVDVGLAA